MRVPDSIRECVAFICYRDKRDNLRYAGTGFFVGVPLPTRPDKIAVYFISAKHTIAGLVASGYETFYIRLNQKKGKAVLAETSASDWEFHEVPSADVAVLAFNPPPEFEHKPFVLEGGVATADVLKTHKIGIGDEIFATGLFISHAGRQRNIPLIRVGTMAAMPEEPINTKMGWMEGYLIEMRSIGGLSGSPVFVYLDPFRHPDEGVFWLLGLIHGHWNIKKEGEPSTALEEDLEQEKVNMGIAIVPPVDRILEVLNMPELAERRAELERELGEQNLPSQ